MPYAERMFPEAEYGLNHYFILQDNVPIHTSAIVSNFLADRIPGRLIEHPPYSPDLNLIENFGSLFKRKFREH